AARCPGQQDIPSRLDSLEEARIDQWRICECSAPFLAPRHKGSQLVSQLWRWWPHPVDLLEFIPLEVEDILRSIEHAAIFEVPTELKKRPPDDRQEQCAIKMAILTDLQEAACHRENREEHGPHRRKPQKGVRHYLVPRSFPSRLPSLGPRLSQSKRSEE